MKKLIALLLIATVVFVNIGVSGCNNEPTKATTKSGPTGSSTEKTTGK